jgi:hypothetical protein
MPPARIEAAALLALTLMWAPAAAQLRQLPRPIDPHLNDFAPPLLRNDAYGAALLTGARGIERHLAGGASGRW